MTKCYRPTMYDPRNGIAPYPIMEEHDFGNFVTLEDFEALQKEAGELRAALRELALTHRPEVERILTDDQIMNAAIKAADELDATRVSERRNGAWYATTIFEGDAGLIRFGRLVEKALLTSPLPQKDET